MGKRVLFIVIDSNDNNVNEETKASVEANLGKEDAYIAITTIQDPERRELYHDLKIKANKVINDVNNFDYVCLVPNGAVLNSEAKTIFSEYQFDREDNVVEIYLPLVLYKADDKTVVLNKHVWNSMISYEPGYLDLELALKQIDSTIFGAFIPTALFFNPEYYSQDVQYYQQYHLLNNLSDGDNLVLGIPKLLLTVNQADFDFIMKGLSNEEKLTHFNSARAKWSSKKESKNEVNETELQTAKA